MADKPLLMKDNTINSLRNSMTQANNQDLLNDSLRRCLNNNQFFPTFYDHFHHSSPEIAALFDKSNLVKLNKMMENSLFQIISASESNWESEQELLEIAKSHKNMNIKQEFYKFWELSLLATVAECDPEYNSEIKAAWKEILSRGVDFMINY